MNFDTAVRNLELFTDRNKHDWSLNVISLSIANEGHYVQIIETQGWLGRKVCLLLHFTASFFTNRYLLDNYNNAKAASETLRETVKFLCTYNLNQETQESLGKLGTLLIAYSKIVDYQINPGYSSFLTRFSHWIYTRAGWNTNFIYNQDNTLSENANNLYLLGKSLNTMQGVVTFLSQAKDAPIEYSPYDFFETLASNQSMQVSQQQTQKPSAQLGKSVPLSNDPKYAAITGGAFTLGGTPLPGSFSK